MTEPSYARVPEVGPGLRLHLNEHTGGCSPRAIDAVRRVGAKGAARYPDYADVTQAAAQYLGVAPDRLLLTNGLDEGILLASLVCLRAGPARPEAIVIEPAFEMYALYADAAGAKPVFIHPRRDFSFPIDEVLASMTPATRLLYLTDPNNPTGQRIPREAIRRMAGALPAGGVVFLDEAYVEFAGTSFLDELDQHPNVLVGRTFAKAFGLAGFRAGALLGATALLDPIRRIAPPYNLNVFVVAALGAALADEAHTKRYLAEANESKRLLYEACHRLGLEYWPSAANFVLVRIGDRARHLVDRLAERGIFIRDRSSAPGCAGCVRITTGLIEHTTACIMAMEDFLCAAGR